MEFTLCRHCSKCFINYSLTTILSEPPYEEDTVGIPTFQMRKLRRRE